MKNLENYGVQELDIKEEQNISGGNPIKDYFIEKLIDSVWIYFTEGGFAEDLESSANASANAGSYGVGMAGYY